MMGASKTIDGENRTMGVMGVDVRWKLPCRLDTSETPHWECLINKV
jgi:hypothetical protein